MKKIALLSLLVTTLFSCSEPAPAPTPETVITGVITNQEGNTVWIENYKEEKIQIDTLNEKGEFEIHFTLGQPSCFEIVNGKFKSYICLAPADTIAISFDTKNINETIAYGGKSAAFNKYLGEKQKISNKLMTEQFDSLYYTTTDTFLINTELWFTSISAPFNAIKADTNINKVLISKEEQALKYEKGAVLLDYKYYHKLMTSDTMVDVSKLVSMVSELNPNNAADLELKSYRNFLQSYVNFYAEEVLMADTALMHQPEGTSKAKQMTIDKKITDPAVKEYLNGKLKKESPAM
ncbi:MAG: hypothetical protein NT150_04670 [Bacteroidetes bacterium]|nr:hypothetical protein [Bacteroidota bacterium]